MGKTIYISGPEHLLMNGKELYYKKVDLCRKYGFEVDPLPDSYFDPLLPKDQKIKLALLRVERIQNCDIIIADVNDFRFSVEPYGESAVELGIAYPLGKEMIGYMRDTRSCGERYPGKKLSGSNGRYTDLNGNGFEPTCLNLMLSQSAVIVEGDFEDALKKLKEMDRK
ncbi:MAG: nucleoside 2-deoxyribosyltransferase [Oscillospiraceae bacterium]|nr:nucleoside 2-deoxyribosyltransferase [Oscillospiraceae bacterium]